MPKREHHDIGYFMSEGAKNMFTHGFMSFAAIGITVACLLIMGTFTLVAVNADANLQELEDTNEILAFVDESLSYAEAKALGTELERIDNVASVEFITREEARENFEAKYEDEALYQDLDDDIFRHRYAIRLRDISQTAETVGDVLLGVVGDSAHMEPTTISTSFSVVRELVALSERLDARILCTESIIGGAGEYGSRYLGKCWLDDSAIRVYEIFDGDEYSVRKGKAQTVQRFSQGVYALYSGETGQAKRTFLELVHDNPADGGARYYLYLADRMERDPELVCGLNPGRTDQRRK